jgi:hypothetical protein
MILYDRYSAETPMPNSYNKKIFYYFMLNYAGTTIGKPMNEIRQVRAFGYPAAFHHTTPAATGRDAS